MFGSAQGPVPGLAPKRVRAVRPVDSEQDALYDRGRQDRRGRAQAVASAMCSAA
jgi:hypothetical protein